MPKLQLQGNITLSAEIFSRLRERGLLNREGAITEEFYYYIAECIARDDSRFPLIPKSTDEKGIKMEPESSPRQTAAEPAAVTVQEITRGLGNLYKPR